MCKVVSLCSQREVSLICIMEHRVTKECLTLFNMNGSLVKTQKSKMKECLSFKPMLYDKLNFYIVLLDMGFKWRLCTSAKEDREIDDQNSSWEHYAIKVYDTIISRHRNANKFILVNDPYDIEESFKDNEHEKRKDNYRGERKNIIIKRNSKFPTAREFNEFFTVKKNKIRLQDFLKQELSVIARKKTRICCTPFKGSVATSEISNLLNNSSA